MSQCRTRGGWKQLESEPALFALLLTDKMSWQFTEIYTLNQLYAPRGEGACPGSPLISSLWGSLSHLSKVDDPTGRLLSLIFSSFFEVLAWEEAPRESLTARRRAAAASEEELRGLLLVAVETSLRAFLPAGWALLWGKLAPSGLLYGLEAVKAFGPPAEESLLRDGFFSAGGSEW